MYKLFLTLRYLRKRRIAYFAIMAVALCVAMVLVVHSVMGGFLDTVRNSSRRLLGDVIIEVGSMETFPFFDEFIGELHQKMGDDIVAATPVIINVGLLKVFGGIERDRTSFAYINGIRLDEYVRINSFGEGLYYNEHYPGTTTFEDSTLPTWSFDDDGLARLSDEYESALTRYQDGLGAAGLPAKFKRHPAGPYAGPGEFAWVDDPYVQDSADEPLPGLIIGVEMVAGRQRDGSYERYYPKGTKAKLSVQPLTRQGDITATGPIARLFRYADDSRTKIYDIDSKNVYVDFDLLQRMLGLDPREYVDGSGTSLPRTTQIQIKLAEGVDYNIARDHIETLWSDFAGRYAERCRDHWDAALLTGYMQVQTWEQRNSGFINAVEKERILVVILFALISMVAILLVGCIFYMIVQEKTREIGIIRSMGATSGGVAGIFLTYALAIGVVGAAIGTTIGTLFVRYINEFQDFIADHIHPTLRVWSPESYSFDRIPDVVKVFDAALIVVVAIMASVIGSLVAARKAANIWPVDAIRYE